MTIKNYSIQNGLVGLSGKEMKRCTSVGQVAIYALLLSGCASQPDISFSTAHSKKNLSVADVEPAKRQGSHLEQCNRDLESLRTVSMTAYRRYTAEYDALMKSSAGFMTVKDDVSPEVAELARPKFQFALVNLCYRIKDALAQTLINQAGGR